MSELDGPRDITSENAKSEEEKIFANKKQTMLEKIVHNLYDKEHRYLDYLNHMVTECEGSTVVENGCPLDRCKLKKTVGFKELRVHLNDVCTKIDMQCSNCKDTFKRPYAKFHDCSNVYEKRLEEK